MVEEGGKAIPTEVRYTRLATPVGALLVAETHDGLLSVWFEAGRRRRPIDPAWRPADPSAIDAAGQLTEYFAGTRRTFDIPLAPRGTAFQRRVWAAVAAISYGETRSYGAIAAEIGAPDGVRAVGAANGQNPWPIIVPCHRVIGSDGSLTGYGGGLAIKRALLEFERGTGRLFADGASWIPSTSAPLDEPSPRQHRSGTTFRAPLIPPP
jgi:methylated-DNA-[protein]-cysteine S-methyltransferase